MNLSRRHALAAALAAIVVYVAIVGPDPSVVRAGIAGAAKREEVSVKSGIRYNAASSTNLLD